MRKLVGVFLCLVLLIICGASFMPQKTTKTVVLPWNSAEETKEGMYALSP
ncbi:MAG: hypothetical protein KH334_02340 [Clostridiales bacterium]|nr:hypothetical protein [Clostridiales bacterium]